MTAARTRGSGDLQVATWKRKRNRFEREAYLGARSYFVTAATRDRYAAFVEVDVVSMCLQILEDAALKCGFSLLAFCFMPNHFHLLVEGSDDSDLAKFMKSFKQRSSHAYRQMTGQTLWQKSYYDHIIRNEDDKRESFLYILQNPLRAGLVENIEDYPFLGGVWIEGMLGGDLKVAATMPRPSDAMALQVKRTS
jgi:putative transposase